MVTASSPSLLLLLTRISKHWNAGLRRTVWVVTLIPSVKTPRPKSSYLGSSQRLAKRKRFVKSYFLFSNIHKTNWKLSFVSPPLVILIQLKGFEFIKAVHLDPEPFDIERDLLTPTYKKKRPQLLKYYQVAMFFSFILFSFVLSLSPMTDQNPFECRL